MHISDSTFSHNAAHINGHSYITLHIQGPDVQSIVSLTISLIKKSLTVTAKVFSNTLIFLLQKCE